MRKVILVSVLFISIVVFGQNKIEIIKDSFPTYQGVIQVEGKTSKQIYSLLKEWTAINFKSAQDVIQLDEPDNGKLIIKGNSSFGYYYMMWDRVSVTKYTILFDIKDNKFRYTIDVTDVTEGGYSMLEYIKKGKPKKYIDLLLNGVSKNINDLKQQLLELSTKKQDNW